jgi:hypothetical protein
MKLTIQTWVVEKVGRRSDLFFIEMQSPIYTKPRNLFSGALCFFALASTPRQKEKATVFGSLFYFIG